MRSLYNPPWDATDSEKRTLRSQAEDLVRLRGVNAVPDPPRDIQVQSGSRKVIVSWSRPVVFDDIASWRVYKGDEKILYQTIKDAGTRICEVSANAGASPPSTNIFISSVSSSGFESRKVQVQGTALTEGAAPSDPAPPQGFTAGGAGGQDTTGGGTGTTGTGDRSL